MTPGAISSDQLATLLQERTPHALIDVRERAAFERGHIFRATPVPRRLLEARLPALVTATAGGEIDACASLMGAARPCATLTATTADNARP